MTFVCGYWYISIRKLDQVYSAAGETPIATRLASFTQVRGLAFGNYAEVSPDVEDLILQCGHASTGEAVGRATRRRRAQLVGEPLPYAHRRGNGARLRVLPPQALRFRRPRAVLDERAQRGLAGGRRGP